MTIDDVWKASCVDREEFSGQGCIEIRRLFCLLAACTGLAYDM